MMHVNTRSHKRYPNDSPGTVCGPLISFSGCGTACGACSPDKMGIGGRTYYDSRSVHIGRVDDKTVHETEPPNCGCHYL